jgi:hypothetical protein
MASSREDGWTLISVLFSNVPLEAGLAATLHETALELYRSDGAMQQVAGDALSGRVVNLRKTLQLGAISGPAFEATLETARGSGKVRYLLTTQGLELAGLASERARPAGTRRKHLLN